MLSGKERDKIYKQVEEQRKKVVEVRKELNFADSQKEEWFSKKEEVGKKISNMINRIKGLKKKRDELTEKVKQSKKERKKYNKFIKNRINEFKELSKEKENLSKKYKINGDPSKIKYEIKKLEEKLETEAVAFDKERKLVGVIKSKKKQLGESAELMNMLSKTKKLSKEIDELKKTADQSHQKIQDFAKNSQEAHLDMVTLSKQIDELKKEKENAYQKFFEFKMKFTKLNKSLKEVLMNMNLFSRKVDTDKKDRKSKFERKNEEIIQNIKKDVEEKLKKGGKLTTEDILVMQQIDNENNNKKK